MTTIIEFKIPLTCTAEWGLNKIYAGVHWTKRKKQAEKIPNMTEQEAKDTLLKIIALSDGRLDPKDV